MRRRLVLLAALALALAPIAPVWAVTNDTGWTQVDAASVARGDHFFDLAQFDDAEAAYREILDRHPNSASALMLHVRALIELARFDEALDQGRKAVELAPENAMTHAWLGIALVRSGHSPEAIDVLKKAIELKPDDTDANVWLAQAFHQTGQQARADLLLDAVLANEDEARQGITMEFIAGTFHSMGDDAAAVAWSRRSYDLGNTHAALCIAWAYAAGSGVPYDAGGSDHWYRRAPEPPFAWFPRLPFADHIINFAHGWLLVLIILLTTALLPWPTVSLVAWCFSRGLTTDPAIHWTERARRCYSFHIFLQCAPLILPAVYLLNVENYPGFALPVPSWILGWVVLAVGFWAANAVVVRWLQLSQPNAVTVGQSMKDLGVMLFLVLPFVAPFMIMAFVLPSQWSWPTVLMIEAGILGYLFIQHGGWIRLGRLFRLLTPANAEMMEDAKTVAQRWKQPCPTVWVIPWRRTTAFAFPFSNAIVVTNGLRILLTRDETKSVLAHELAHLCEDQSTRLLRLFVPLLLLPVFTLSLWSSPNFWAELLGCYAILTVGYLILRKRARGMEERADSFGKDAGSEAGVYPLALAKLYEVNLIPAVMPGKRKVHPHLYDRLLASGITPDYPRPKPPGRWGFIGALLMTALNVIALTAIWLALF